MTITTTQHTHGIVTARTSLEIESGYGGQPSGETIKIRHSKIAQRCAMANGLGSIKFVRWQKCPKTGTRQGVFKTSNEA